MADAHPVEPVVGDARPQRGLRDLAGHRRLEHRIDRGHVREAGQAFRRGMGREHVRVIGEQRRSALRACNRHLPACRRRARRRSNRAARPASASAKRSNAPEQMPSAGSASARSSVGRRMRRANRSAGRPTSAHAARSARSTRAAARRSAPTRSSQASASAAVIRSRA